MVHQLLHRQRDRTGMLQRGPTDAGCRAGNVDGVALRGLTKVATVAATRQATPVPPKTTEPVAAPGKVGRKVRFCVRSRLGPA
jgi:hypothetical protein